MPEDFLWSWVRVIIEEPLPPRIPAYRSGMQSIWTQAMLIPGYIHSVIVRLYTASSKLLRELTGCSVMLFKGE
jgi:hypothetical protein